MIPCCFHPTRVVIVDKSVTLMKWLDETLFKFNLTFDFFHTPHKALHYINEIYNPSPFTKRYNGRLSENKIHPFQSGRILDTHQEIYRPQRFEEISTVVLDYDSTDPLFNINGLEFFEKIKSTHIQKILLCEEKNLQDAIHASNSGLIHSFICKADTAWRQSLQNVLQETQWSYFNKLTEDFMGPVGSVDILDHAIVDPNFHNFFRALITNHGFSEAYLWESTGSYLFLDEQAQDHGLVVNIATQLDRWARTGQAKGISFPLLKALKNRKKMMCYHTSLGILEPDKGHWEIYAHPAKTLKGKKNTFYYAFAPNMYDIDVEKILPFEDYKETQENGLYRFH
ncbi:MAG: hypothetical protein FJX71_03690 [Alphaproteobacteria bacterium]|nr:hypothetical protein [Alphaproteobacteria bacterium]